MRANLNNEGVSIAIALDPDSSKVDARDHRDRLAFAAEFAQFILYYDKTNSVAGDWRPFFLKDPAILMAAISKADPGSYYATFSSRQGKLKDNKTEHAEHIGFASQLCTLSANMLVLLDTWLKLMSRDADTYVLYAFLKLKVEASLSGQLKSLTALQQTLSFNSEGKIAPPDTQLFHQFESVWRDHLPHRPEHVASDITLAQGCVALKQIYDTVFSVFTQVVQYAEQAFVDLEYAATPYPDTALLMVFSKLMDIQQRDINRLGHQHLDFYYQTVLQQTLKPAQIDQMYVFLTLSPNVSTLSLPAGTPFKAGVYADGSDIIFLSDKETQLNRAAVAQVNTLYHSPATGGLYLSTIATADQLLRNAKQEVRCWDAFGNAEGMAVQQGFALASPMLLLQGGTRTITVAFQASQPGAAMSTMLIEDARYYLSTEKAWLDVTQKRTKISDICSFAPLQFVLEPSDPAIVAFKQGPDGFTSPWPMLKVVLGPTQPFTNPPGIATVSITVTVEGFNQLTLANDLSPLPTTGLAPLFGPVPALGQSFYAGSNECFAKPLTELGLTVLWDNLPPSFADYYAAYNAYLTTDPPPDKSVMFDNTAFKVSCQVLSNNSWIPMLAVKGVPSKSNAAYASTTSLFQPGAPLPGPSAAIPQDANANANSSLFSFQVGAQVACPMPGLVLSPLPPVGQASHGYIRLQLVAPVYGFGHSLYARLLTDFSLKSAAALIGAATVKPDSTLTVIWKVLKKLAAYLAGLLKKTPTVPSASAQDGGDADLLQPNVPFSPKKLGISVSYTATCTINVSQTEQDPVNPLALYHYGSFKPYLAYDSQAIDPRPNFPQLTPQSSAVGGALPLYPGVAAPGGLYVALSKVTAPCVLSVFVEVLTDLNLSTWNEQAVSSVYYWTADGWQALTVLRDDTHNLSQSGIITLDLPGLPPGTQEDDGLTWVVSPVMPGKDFWLAINAPHGASIRLSYLNTQALRLSRNGSTSVPLGVTPLMEASSTVSTQPKVAKIATIVQPFPSFGGQPSEDTTSFDQDHSFYRRVSTRLNHKDRASSRNNYVDLAYDACSSLYYAKVLTNKKHLGQMCIGLVNGYANPQLPGAFAPVISVSAQRTIQQHLTQRASAMAQISVQNMRHQIISIDVAW